MITIRPKGLDAARRRVNEIADRAQDLTPAMQVAGETMVKFIDDRFRSETDPTGERWKELADSTKARRRKGTGKNRDRAHKILTDTARLRRSMHSDASPPPFTTTSRSFKWGTDVEYAGVHQSGSKDGKLVARSFLPVVISGNRVSLVTTGPAGKLWPRIQKYIASYIATGKVSP